MPYAKGEQISNSPIEGGIAISDIEYAQARDAKLSGKKVIVYDGALLTLTDDVRTVYSTTDKSAMEIRGNEPVPEGYTTEIPDDFDVWEDGAWAKDQSAHREAMKARVDQIRGVKISQGLSYTFPDGSGVIQLRDAQDYSNVLGLGSSGTALVGMGDTSTTLAFRDAENVSHVMSGAEAMAMGLAVSAFVADHYAAAWAHKDALDAGADPETYDITAGWPS